MGSKVRRAQARAKAAADRWRANHLNREERREVDALIDQHLTAQLDLSAEARRAIDDHDQGDGADTEGDPLS
jgi:hypothetical protein